MEPYETLILSGILAGAVSFFVNYVDLPFNKTPAGLVEDTRQLKDRLPVVIAGYVTVGVAGALLTPLLDAIMNGLKGLSKPKFDTLVLFGYGLVFGYSTTRLLASVLDLILKKVSIIEEKGRNLVILNERLAQLKAADHNFLNISTPGGLNSDPVKPPHGYDEIKSLFGDPSDPADISKVNAIWQSENIKLVRPPVGWQLYYQENDKPLVKISGIQMHVLLADSFTAGLTEIWNYAKQALGQDATEDSIRQWLHDKKLDQTGGGFNYRPSTANPKVLSLHAFGIAIDWDPVHNPRGSKTSDLPDWWYEIWHKNGWSNGKHFPTPDPMHIQFATGA